MWIRGFLILQICLGAVFSNPVFLKSIPVPGSTKAACGLREGGFAVLGSIESAASSQYMGIVLSHFDSAGNPRWSKTFTDSSDHLQGNSVIQTADGGFAIAAILGASAFEPAAYIIKTDSLGNVEFRKAFSQNVGAIFSPGSRAFDVAETLDSGFVLAGTGQYFGVGHPTLLKIDKHGDIAWIREFRSSPWSEFRTVKAIPGGGLIVAGEEYLQPESKTRAVLLRLDPEGRTVWLKGYTHSRGFETHASDIELTGTGGFVVAGFSGDGWNASVSDGLMVEFDRDGNVMRSFTIGSQRSAEKACNALFLHGGWFITGTIQDFHEGFKTKILKMDAEGRFLWAYGLPEAGFDDRRIPVISQGTGTFVVCSQDCILFEDPDYQIPASVLKE